MKLIFQFHIQKESKKAPSVFTLKPLSFSHKPELSK